MFENIVQIPYQEEFSIKVHVLLVFLIVGQINNNAVMCTP